MIDPQEPLPDELIEEMLAPLRAAKLPDQAHAVNMAAVRRALSRRARSAWWQRTVAVPIPVAIAATLALAFTTVAMLRPSGESLKTDDGVARPTQAEAIATGSVSNSGADRSPSANWSVSRSYIGSIESLANTHTFLPIDVKENRDAS